MKILLTNRRMEKFGGSELVTLELAEELQSRGHNVLIYTGVLLEPMVSASDVPITNVRPELGQFDLIWCHHNMILGYKPRISQRVIFNHMSSYVDLEFPQNAQWEEEVGERIFANSPETQDQMVKLGLSRCEVFPNPAPSSFERTEEGRYGLFISNHRPMGMKMAAIHAGCVNKFIGEADRFQRVTPELIAGANFVVTSGKTVQYALRAGKPIFLFDHFNGPGWLTNENIDKAAWFNFSGRCSRENTNMMDLAHWRGRDVLPCPEVMKLEYWMKELQL